MLDPAKVDTTNNTAIKTWESALIDARLAPQINAFVTKPRVG